MGEANWKKRYQQLPMSGRLWIDRLQGRWLTCDVILTSRWVPVYPDHDPKKWWKSWTDHRQALPPEEWIYPWRKTVHGGNLSHVKADGLGKLTVVIPHAEPFLRRPGVFLGMHKFGTPDSNHGHTTTGAGAS